MKDKLPKKNTTHDQVWLPPQRKTEEEMTEEEKRQILIKEVMRQERLSMIEYVRRHTPALEDATPCYRFFGE